MTVEATLLQVDVPEPRQKRKYTTRHSKLEVVFEQIKALHAYRKIDGYKQPFCAVCHRAYWPCATWQMAHEAVGK